TKLVAISPFFVYVFFRGILLPWRRGAIFSKLLPIRFIGISFVCLIADATKALVFSMPRRKRQASEVQLN
ncbi:MAG: hypothetical protein ACOYMG_21745, partial [Candidatus Methylumidiphilus sp.]